MLFWKEFKKTAASLLYVVYILAVIAAYVTQFAPELGGAGGKACSRAGGLRDDSKGGSGGFDERGIRGTSGGISPGKL